MGLPPSEWDSLTEIQQTILPRIHRHVKAIEDQKWTERFRAILKALGAVK